MADSEDQSCDLSKTSGEIYVRPSCGGESERLNSLKMLLVTAGMLKMSKDYFCGIKMTKGTKGTNSSLH